MCSPFPRLGVMVVVLLAWSRPLAAEPPPFPVAFAGAVPSHAGDGGLFAVPGAYTLPAREVSASVGVRDGGAGTLSAFTAGWGLVPRVELFGHARHLHGSDDVDVALGAKWQLTDDRAGDGIALALRAVVEPASSPALRVDGVASSTLWAGVVAHAAAGVEHREEEDVLWFGAGAQWQLARRLDAELEVAGRRPFDGDTRTPLDVAGGLTVAATRSLLVRGGLSYAARGADPSRRRLTVLASLGWHPGPAPARRVEPR